MTAPQIIVDLVESFKKNEHIYTDSNLFDEENTKTDFINPFFEALGWDVTNKNHRSPQFKDVVYEKSIKVGTKTKAPDYEFRVGGTPIFFVEAKKPSVNIESDKNPAFQIRRYGWSAKLKLCILTDFEELAVYETNIKPDKKQSASIGRVKYYHYSEYVEKWDEIASIFSKEAVLNGDFDNFAEANSDKKKKGTGEVDDEFLKEMEHWRDLLARNIALRNKDLNEDALNYAVQITIDRILFCRMAEDRGIEKYGTLLELTKKDNIYQHLMEVFKIAHLKYNSGLFCLSADPARHINRDMVTEHLTIDDGVFKEIFTNLYYPNSPYEFSVISPEILGQVYEQLLGSIIRLTPAHMAKVEEKPEVKKAGGVFYTPSFIVKDIVKKTVGKLIKDKTPNQISKIRILDPACGSGSFLIEAYQELLNYHLDYYTNLEKPPKDTIYQGKDGEWRLTIREKKRILKNNIYGVDLDFLAVEVTKLSLLLKVLEDQNKDVVEQQQKLFHERVLPDLSDNIKNGNSLISTDYITLETDIEDIKSIKPFNYVEEFPLVFVDGGFDIIVGNPPYVRQELIKDQKPYYKNHYQSYTGVADLYVYFFENGLNLLKDNGSLGFICSNKYTRANYGKNLRKFLLNYNIKHYDDYGGKKVFKHATVDAAVIVINKSKVQNNIISVNNNEFEINQNNLTEDSWAFHPPEVLNLIDKVFSQGIKLGDIPDIKINNGIKTGYNKAFVIDKKTKDDLIAKDENNAQIIKPVLRGRDILRWKVNFEEKYLIFTRRGIKINSFPVIKEYLSQYKKNLNPRNNGQSIGRKPGKYKWYEIQDTIAYYEDFENPKLIWAEITQSPNFYYDEDGYYMNNKCFMISSDETNLKVLNAIFLSTLFEFLYRNLGSNLGEKGLELRKVFLVDLPIVIPDEDKQSEIIGLVDEIIHLNKELKNIKSPTERNSLNMKIELIDKEINNLIYDLYNISNQEIKIIEENI